MKLAPKNPKIAIYLLFVTIVIDMLGIGIILPVLPQIIQEVGNLNVVDAAKIGGFMIAAFSFAQFIMSPIIGNLSDAYGRRKIILCSVLGYSLDWLLLAFANSLFIFFIGRLISGSFAAIFATAMAYISDLIEAKKRAAYFGLVGAGFGIGFTLGPFIGGYFGDINPRLPFIIAASMSFINFIFVYFFLPESLPKEDRRKFELKRANPISSIIKVSKYPNILTCFVAFILFQMAQNSIPAVWAYYTEEKFQWSSFQIGISLTCVGIAAIIFQAFFVKKSIAFLGRKKAIFLGLLTLATSLFAYGLITISWYIYVVIFTTSFSGIIMPSIQSVMTEFIPKNQQGELQGAIASLMSLTLLTSSLWSTQIFHLFSNKEGVYFPGAPLLIGGTLALLAIIPILSLKIKEEQK